MPWRTAWCLPHTSGPCCEQGDASRHPRAPLRELAKRLRADAEIVLAGLSSEQCLAVERVTQDCADLLQRSSSCVEGRNGQLSLRHHSLHRITLARLQALTAVHNYFIHRPDGTTAAERFFGTAPADMSVSP